MVPGEPEPDALAAVWGRCRARHPTVALDLETFRAHIEARRPPEVAAADQLATFAVEDLYLACAAAAGDPAAVLAVERELAAVITAALGGGSGGGEPAVVEEARQRMRAMLLVDHAGRGPLLAQYSGRGPLRRWLGVAMREAGGGAGAGATVAPAAPEALLDALVPASDPALGAIAPEAVASFKDALLAALRELDPRARTSLALHVLDGLAPDEIAPLQAAQPAMVARGIGAAKQVLLERTRGKLSLDASTADALLQVVQSRLGS